MLHELLSITSVGFDIVCINIACIASVVSSVA